MGLSLVALICFVAITLVTITAVLLVRDLLAPATSGARGVTVRPQLRRRPNVLGEAPSRTIAGRLDQAFNRLVLETGFAITPWTTFLVSVAGGLLLGGVLWIYFDHLLTGIAGALLGMAAPLSYLAHRRGRRLREIRQELPNVLAMLARAVRAGESLDQAIGLVGSEAGGHLRHEFRQCARQLEMGRSMAAVFKALATRVRLVEFRMLATTLAVQRQTGGNLAETLDRMANVVRERVRLRRHLRAATGAGRTSALLIATISPLAYLVIFLWQPQHIRPLMEEPIGQLLFGTAIVLELIGIIWIAALLRQET